MFNSIRKRDGRLEPFRPEKITEVVLQAAQACGGDNRGKAEHLRHARIRMARERDPGPIISVEQIQDLVERALIKNRHARTAKA